MDTLNILSTKIFIPGTRPESVIRGSLIEQINTDYRSGLILVSAPAGFGKTTLVCNWIHRKKIEVAWYSLDPGDNDISVFFSYLIAAFQRIDKRIGESCIPMVQASEPEPEQVHANLIRDLIRIEQDFVLVLEDYQFISNDKIIKGIEFLIDKKPPNLHIVIISRRDPKLPLHRYRAKGILTEIRAQQLSFTDDEAYAFFNKVMGLELSTLNVARLNKRTEGWITGLQMAALSMKSHEDIQGFIQSFTGNNRFVLDYLLEEVIAVQSEEIRIFLLKTSLLERFDANLCEAVTGIKNSQELLDILDRENLFIIPLDHNKSWYRYHHLFADLLRKKLNDLLHDQIPSLHRNASRWFTENNFIQEAIGHSMAAKDWQNAAVLVEKTFMDRMNRGEDFATMYDRLDSLPEEMICSRPGLCIMYAWMNAIMYQFDDAEAYLRRVENLDNPKLTGDQVMQIEAIRAEIARTKGDLEAAIETSKKIIHSIQPGPSANYVQMQNFTASLITLSWSYYECGDMDLAEKTFRESINIGKSAGSMTLKLIQQRGLAQALMLQGSLRSAGELFSEVLDEIEKSRKSIGQLPTAAAYIYIDYSNYLRELNRLPEAYQYVRRGLDLGISRRIDGGSLRDGYINLARIQFARNDLKGYRDAWEEAGRALNPYFQIPGFRAPLSTWRANLAFSLNFDNDTEKTKAELNHLDDWISARDLSEEPKTSTIYDELETLVLARWSMKAGKFQGALDKLEFIIDQARTGKRKERVITALILKSVCLESKGTTNEAIQTLNQSIALAAKEGYIRIFLDEGERVINLMRTLTAPETRDLYHIDPGENGNYLRKLIHSYDSLSFKISRKDIPDPLTDREMEVLILLSLDHSNQKIAEKLFISVDTVKSHLKNINLKLNTANRKQAVEKAGDLGIL